MKNNLKTILLLCLFMSNLIAQDTDKITLQLQWKHQFEFAGFYAAKEKGFYNELGLDVEFKEFDTNMNIVEEVVSGKAQYGLTYSSLIAEYMKDKPVIFVANFFKQSPLVLVTQTDIKTPADLKDKKIMGLLDSSHKQSILAMLDKFNLSENDFINVPRKFTIESFLNKEVDAVSVFTTNEIFELQKQGIKYNMLDPAAFGTKFYDINLFTTKNEYENNPKRIDDFKKASIKGWEYALANKEEIVNLILKKYNTQNKSKEALLFESNQIEYLMLRNIFPIGSIDISRVEMISQNYTQTLGITQKSKEQLEQFIYKSKKNKVLLNEDDKQYLKNKKQIRMCTDPNWMPLEKIENGKHVGLAADFLKLISKKIDTPIELVQTKNWSESITKIKNRECDILSLAGETPLRLKYLNFTTPYVSLPMVIATKKGNPFIDNINRIIEKPLGIVKGYAIDEMLKAKYPKINLVQVSSIKEGLELVAQEKIFGFLDNALVINDEIQKNQMYDNIVISGQFSETSYLGIGSRNDEPILGEILEKALLAIDPLTQENITNNWKNITYQTKTDYGLILKLVFIIFVIVSVFIYWNIQLQQEIKSKELAKEQLKISEEKFRTLFDIAPILLNSFDKNGKILLWNKECERVFGWSENELLMHENPIELFYPDSKVRQELADSISLKNDNSYKQWYPKTKDEKILTTIWANIHLPNSDIIHIGYDITQQKKDERSIREKTEQLRVTKDELEKLNNSLEERISQEISKNTEHQIMLMQQSKLAQMGEMIENIAHQWRQPLAQINSSVLLVDIALNKNNVEDNMIEDKLLEIESLTAYMSKTIDDFKNFFNPNKQKSVVYVKDAIEKACAIVKGALASQHIIVEIDVEKKLTCYCYLAELQQVILTILNNAKDALTLNNISLPKISIKAYQQENNVVIDIYDNALGIDNEIIHNIFEPYFTTKHKSQGTGLGLYMAKMIIESGLNGTLSVSNKDDGACFTIEIADNKV